MVKRYQQQLLLVAKEMDASNKIEGNLTELTTRVITNNSSSAAKQIFKILSAVVKMDDDRLLQLCKDYNDVLLKFYGSQKLHDIYTEIQKTDEEIVSDVELSLAELVDQLHHLVGLEKVKDKITDLISFQRVQHLRKNQNLSNPKNTLHLAFTGNPGTGKTTVARIVGKIYKQLGLLSKGHFIEVSRTDLIAGFQGQTALKVKDVIEKAKGGVLFIDEAYSITENEQSDSYGRECLTELTKALEDFRDDLVVIVAGYTQPMEIFFNSNPGLKSRFNTFIKFEDYSNVELQQIILDFIHKNDYTLDIPAGEKIKSIFIAMSNELTVKSSNGRFVRNLYDDLIMEHARRVSTIENPILKELHEITEVDVENVFLSIIEK